MVTLYEHPLSPYAQKVKISAREKGIALDLRTPDGIGAGSAQGEFVAANPGLKILDTAYAQEDYAIGVAKGNTQLLDAINGALEELQADGTLQAIVDKYITAE